MELAGQAIHIERERVKDIGGHQDQYAAAFGGLLHVVYGPGDKVAVNRIALSSERRIAFEQSFLMFYTGTDHSAQRILASQTSRTQTNNATLARMGSFVSQAIALLTSDGELTPFGELLHDSWALKQSLADGISNARIGEAYDSARTAGAIGGKLLGAGGRGFILLFVPKESQGQVRAALSDLQEVPFTMSPHGSKTIFKEA